MAGEGRGRDGSGATKQGHLGGPSSAGEEALQRRAGPTVLAGGKLRHLKKHTIETYKQKISLLYLIIIPNPNKQLKSSNSKSGTNPKTIIQLKVALTLKLSYY